MRRDYVIIDHVEGGQPRPYADSVYSAYISLRREGMLLNNQKFYVQLDERKVKDLARLCVRSFDDEPKNWASALDHIAAFDPTTCAELVREVLELRERWNTRFNTLCGNCSKRYRGPRDEHLHGIGICGGQP
jgi:hypothetical protein